MPSDGWRLKEKLIIFLIIFLWWLTYGKCIWWDDWCRTRNVNESQLGILVWMWLNPISIDATSLNKNNLLGFTKTISAGHAYITRVCVFDVPPHLEGPSDWNLTNLKHGWFLLKMTSLVRIPWDPVFCPYIFGKTMRLKLSSGKSYKSWYCGKANNKASPSHHEKWVV